MNRQPTQTMRSVDDGLVESVQEALARRRALRVMPFILAPLDGVRERVQADRRATERLDSCEGALRDAALSGAPVALGTASASRAGRIVIKGPDLQNVPNAVRMHVVPSTPGSVFVDVDMKSAHAWIAAHRLARVGDDKLLQDLHRFDDFYTGIGAHLWAAVGRRSPMPSTVRRTVKQGAVLPFLNGAAEDTVAAALVSDFGNDAGAAARAFGILWSRRYPGWQSVVGWARSTAAQGGRGDAEVATLLNQRRVIPLGKKGAHGWRTLLSALWTTVEAEVLAHVLERLHGRVGALGAALVLPMYDGLLIEAPTANRVGVGRRLRKLMQEAAVECGVPGMVAEATTGPTWGSTNEPT